MTVDRSHPPVPGAVRSFEFPTVRSTPSVGGLTLRVARLPRLPVVAASLVIPAGEAGLELGRAGHAALTAHALEGGTRTHTGSALAEALEGIGASLQAFGGWDATTVSLACLADRLGKRSSCWRRSCCSPRSRMKRWSVYGSSNSPACASVRWIPRASLAIGPRSCSTRRTFHTPGRWGLSRVGRSLRFGGSRGSCSRALPAPRGWAGSGGGRRRGRSGGVGCAGVVRVGRASARGS